MESLQVAFKKIGEIYVPTHMSEIKVDDCYYLVVDGKREDNLKATADAELNPADNTWVVKGKPA